MNKYYSAGAMIIYKKLSIWFIALLLSGCTYGPQDRNESLLGHKHFLVISDYLTRNGFTVLRYDDRGVGKSTGDFKQADLYII